MVDKRSEGRKWSFFGIEKSRRGFRGLGSGCRRNGRGEGIGAGVDVRSRGP